ncbi:hypothetical protein BACCAP_01137 [Pseudoflavonifractor capillosus ATCC 29799]|uniref:Uncharacterized protein n=1 Tax=Pseudoflavonifractor capillosus ATCC 29799 TaxID=411467 RepID=A6NSF7_9FIRM|nr:hypothetical protein BACCAP_01137 [Pseudoflavonifractor capillosus ATCC 29799]
MKAGDVFHPFGRPSAPIWSGCTDKLNNSSDAVRHTAA